MSEAPSNARGPGPAAPTFKKAEDFALEKDWKGYFGAVLGKPPRETLLDALARFETEIQTDTRDGMGGQPTLQAIDLGCGEGRDTLELLRRGWDVLAIDLMPEAFEHLLPRVAPEHRARLRTRVSTFEEAELAPESCDLLNASFALPFCAPGRFGEVWLKIATAIRRGGRFAGQLFGDRDDWVRCGDRHHHTRPEVEAMFRGFVLEHLREEEKQQDDGKGGKHWHAYHIVARKR